MSEYLQRNEWKLEDLKYILDGLNLEVCKVSKTKKGCRRKILTYNQGYIQYVNKDDFISRQEHQSRLKQSVEEQILNHGYLTYKAGVHFSLIKKNEDQSGFRWTNDFQNECCIIIKFSTKHKIIYNPNPLKQKEDQQKQKKFPEKDVQWKFDVNLQSEIAKIKNRLFEIEEKRQFQIKLIACNSFIEKFDKMDIQIQNSKSLQTEISNQKIEIKFLGYISNKLKNSTNRKIVNADIAARSLFIYLSKFNEYQINKLSIIENMLNSLYLDYIRNFDQNVIQIAKDQFQSNLEELEIVDVLLLNALMYHFQFSINLNVKKFINFAGFYQSLDFKSLQDLSNQINLIIPHNNNEMNQMNYENFQILQQQQYQLSNIERYCIGLFGEENQYLGICYMFYNEKSLVKRKENLEKAINLFGKHLNLLHPLRQQALQELDKLANMKDDQENQENLLLLNSLIRFNI